MKPVRRPRMPVRRSSAAFVLFILVACGGRAGSGTADAGSDPFCPRVSAMNVTCSPGTVALACGLECPPDDSTKFCVQGAIAGEDPYTGPNGWCCLASEFPSCTGVGACQYQGFPISCPTGTPGPMASDPNVACAAPDEAQSGPYDDYCCEQLPQGCSAAPTVSYPLPALGYSCAPGNNPGTEDPTILCTVPVPDSSGNDDYCCFTPAQSAEGCVPNFAPVASCSANGAPTSMAFLCDSSSDLPPVPNWWRCPAAARDADGAHWDFCCGPT
jgi:hypothetical protein